MNHAERELLKAIAQAVAFITTVLTDRDGGRTAKVIYEKIGNLEAREEERK